MNADRFINKPISLAGQDYKNKVLNDMLAHGYGVGVYGSREASLVNLDSDWENEKNILKKWIAAAAIEKTTDLISALMAWPKAKLIKSYSVSGVCRLVHFSVEDVPTYLMFEPNGALLGCVMAVSSRGNMLFQFDHLNGYIQRLSAELRLDNSSLADTRLETML